MRRKLGRGFSQSLAWTKPSVSITLIIVTVIITCTDTEVQGVRLTAARSLGKGQGWLLRSDLPLSVTL